MSDRLAAMTGVRPDSTAAKRGPYIGTFHALGASILRRECGHLGRTPNFVIFDDHDSFDLIKKSVKAILPKHDGEPTLGATARRREKTKESPAYFSAKISELKNRVEEGASSTDAENALVQKIFASYESALERNNAFDFDDLIEKPVALFLSRPDILKKYQNRFDAILVDEYQDINPKQYQLVRMLAGAHHNLTVVGDDEQTIYTWRYADIKIFLGFERDWPGATVRFLEENYRSTGTIVNAASAMVKNNRLRTPKKLWTSAAAGTPIVLYEAWGENDEAAWIAARIADARGSNADIAVLYRTNAQSRAIEQALIRENIPYRIFGGLKFYERREVKDAVAALRYAANPRDELSRERLEKNLTKKKFAAYRAALAAAGSTKADGAETMAPSETLAIFLETFGYMTYLEEGFTNADEREENIAELARFAGEFERLPDFLERLSLLQATDDENASAGERAPAGSPLFDDTAEKSGSSGIAARPKASSVPPVHLSTIHMAKGLEFAAVFIAGAGEGLLPHERSIEKEASLEEERRLMYVAMTRAKKSLSISFYGLPSRFIGEIPEEFITFKTAADIESTSGATGTGGPSAGTSRRFQNDYDDEIDNAEPYISI